MSSVGIAFFYFKFDDTSKKGESVMVRALSLQLARQIRDCKTDLIRLMLHARLDHLRQKDPLSVFNICSLDFKVYIYLLMVG
jgi:hypothetical protein